MTESHKPLRIWLVCVGEYLPIDPGNERQLRMALLARTLHDAGHDITWWCSTFDHEAKRLRFHQDTEVPVSERYRIHLLHGAPYRRNISWQRLVNHRQVADAFTAMATQQAPPDLIVVTVPIVELACEAAKYATEHDVPLVVDVRDQHPDIYLTLLPKIVRGLGRVALRPLYNDLRSALRAADGVTATSESFLKWALQHAGRERNGVDAVFPLAYPELPADQSSWSDLAEKFEGMGIDPSRRIIWYVGTFNRWIDLGTPIRAARALAIQGQGDVLFVLSGDGDYATRWRAMAADLPNVRFTGWIREHEIAYLRHIAWAGLAPYRRGFSTMGNKLFEFMSGGLPILCSLEGEPRRLLESLGAGLFYTPAEDASLAAAVKRLATEPDLHARMSVAGREAYHREFRAEAVYGRMVEYLETRAAGRRPRGAEVTR